MNPYTRWKWIIQQTESSERRNFTVIRRFLGKNLMWRKTRVYIRQRCQGVINEPLLHRRIAGFVLYKDNMNTDKLIDFMRRLVHDSKHKVFLILDNLRVHHAKKISAWLEKHKSEIEVFFLPPYAPEYNPDELLNSDLKRGISKRPSPRSYAELEHNVCSHLKTVQLRPSKIQGFFGSITTRYAA